MDNKSRASLLAVFLLAFVAAPGQAQDQFGRSVAVGGDEIVVMKPNVGRGPAAVYVFRQSSGTWSIVHRMLPAVTLETGEGFGPSLALGDGMLIVGSGDPGVQRAAHVFNRNGAGDWVEGIPVSLGNAASDNSGPLDLAGIMRILQSPARVVALDGERAAVSVVGGPAGLGGLTIMQHGSAGQWTESARLEVIDGAPNDRFGAALAMANDVVLAGASRHADSGAVYVFALDSRSDQWSQVAKIQPSGTGPGSQFGAAVAFDGQVGLVGAPGNAETAGVIIAYSLNEATGQWSELGRLSSPSEAPQDLFGSSIAVSGNDLWVGAPGADDGTGRIYRFHRTDPSAPWLEAPLEVTGSESGFRLGTALALNQGVAVAGAPGADGGRGRAAAFVRSAGGDWVQNGWLEPGGELEMVAGDEVRCDDGQAGEFACGDVDMMAFLPTEAIGGAPGERVSDIWGWTDPITGEEYALVGRTGGAAFLDVTSPSNPIYVGVLPGNPSGARDLKAYQDHLFFTGDGAGDHGMLVFDLARLRNVVNPPVTFEPDAKYEGIASAHNLIIDTEAGFAYAVGASGAGETCGGGLHMVDIRDPLNPTFAGCYTDTEGLIWPGRTHDAQCVVYSGPDDNYRGKQICFASNETALRIVDVTDKESPLPISAATYPGRSYVHQGWLTEDQRYFYMNDELDELVGQAERTRTLVWDVAELDDPVMVTEFFGPNGATDHNLYIKGNRMYQANYQAGLRVIDISDPENPVEVGFFDTTPYNGNPPGFNGAWTAYPFFESGTVIVSSMNEGLFILRPRRRELVP